MARMFTPPRAPGPSSNKLFCLLQRDPAPSAEARVLMDWITSEAQLTDALQDA